MRKRGRDEGRIGSIDAEEKHLLGLYETKTEIEALKVSLERAFVSLPLSEKRAAVASPPWWGSPI